MCFTKSRNFKDVFMVGWGGTNLPSAPLHPPPSPTIQRLQNSPTLWSCIFVSFQQQITFKFGSCTNFEAFCLVALVDFLVPVQKSVEESIRDTFQIKLEFGRISFVGKPSEGRTSNKLNFHMTSTLGLGWKGNAFRIAPSLSPSPSPPLRAGEQFVTPRLYYACFSAINCFRATISKNNQEDYRKQTADSNKLLRNLVEDD